MILFLVQDLKYLILSKDIPAKKKAKKISNKIIRREWQGATAEHWQFKENAGTTDQNCLLSWKLTCKSKEKWGEIVDLMQHLSGISAKKTGPSKTFQWWHQRKTEVEKKFTTNCDKVLLH